MDIQPPVRLLSDAELPADHVVKDITPDMLAEGMYDVGSVASLSGPMSGNMCAYARFA